MKRIIVYFSGTGNSFEVASTIGEHLQCPTHYMPHTSSDTLRDATDIIIVCPVYSFGLPPIVADFVKSNSVALQGKCLNFVSTFGGITANTANATASVCKDLGIDLQNFYKIRMPMNFTVAVSFPKAICNGILKKCRKKSISVAEKIKAGVSKTQRKTLFAFLDKVNQKNLPSLKRTAKEKFSVSSECVKCRQCVELCACNNITLDQSISFGENCTACFACVHRCPQGAIKYGDKKKTLKQYKNPNVDFSKMK